jgi:hypothetical protein
VAQVLVPHTLDAGSLGCLAPVPAEVVVVDRLPATVEHEAVMAAADVEPEGPLGRTQREGDALALISERLSGRVRVVAPAAVLALGLGRRVADHDVTQ